MKTLRITITAPATREAFATLVREAARQIECFPDHNLVGGVIAGPFQPNLLQGGAVGHWTLLGGSEVPVGVDADFEEVR